MKYTKEILTPIVAESRCMADVLRRLGVSVIAGGTHAHVKKMIKLHNISTSHFLGFGSNKGKEIPRKKVEDILVLRDSIYKEKSHKLRRAMISIGIEYKCIKCGIDTWVGKMLRLHIEHKDGNPMDCRPDNVEFLCPHCHSQTDTYAIINSKRTRGGTGLRD